MLATRLPLLTSLLTRKDKRAAGVFPAALYVPKFGYFAFFVVVVGFALVFAVVDLLVPAPALPPLLPAISW
jgi:hypothetical protein